MSNTRLKAKGKKSQGVLQRIKEHLVKMVEVLLHCQSYLESEQNLSEH